MAEGYFALPECQNATRLASALDHYTFDIEFKEIPSSVRNMTNKALNWVQSAVITRWEEDCVSHKGKEGKAQLKIELSPRVSHINVTLATPNRKIEIENLPVENEWMKSLVLVHPDLAWNERLASYAYNGEMNHWNLLARCHAHSSSQSWRSALEHSHFYASDVEQRWSNGFDEHEQITVLTRTVENNQQHLKVVLGQQEQWDYNIDIVPNGAQLPIVYVNDEPLQVHDKYTIPMYTADEGEQPLVRVHALAGKELVVDIRDGQIVIVCDGYRAQILTGQTFYDNTVGLCGTNNKQEEDDFITPQQCVMRKPEYFAASWAVTGQNCTGPAKAFAIASQQKQKEACLKVEYMYGNVVSDVEAGRKRYRYYNHNVDSSSSSESDSSSSSSSSESSESNNKSDSSSSSSSSGSSSSSESKEHNPAKQKYSGKECDIVHQVQYVERGSEICFSKRPLPSCNSRCKAIEVANKYFDYHCRPLEDSIAQMWKEQIRKGVNPDMSAKSVSKTIKMAAPKKCVYIQ
ncbi:hypothetical protein pipiens_018928 [Culex pipiens pipiens]|uniref:VWFD domain-containing protein n=1 Tax=Culex pipiens pipiens TaxID=38569 RepID=A0ABD1DZ17_CULPP